MSPTILLVEPDATSSYSWERLLRTQSFRVVCAHNGREAIQANHDFHPDLILLRDALPDLPGCEVSARIRQDIRSRMTPLVLIRSHSEGDGILAAKSSGIDEVLDEASSATEKLASIHEWLAWKTEIDHEAESVLLSLARCIESRDPGTEGHCERISAYAMRLGDSLGLNDEDIHALSIGGVLHDLGKIRVPDAILLKPGPLTTEERAILREHPVTGERICSPLKAFQKALPIIRHHHERMDGSGYPDGLCGEAIPLNARILQTVDVYDALTTDRPYRKALSADEALGIMREEAGRGWMDQRLVDQVALLLTGLRSDAQFVDFCRAYGDRQGVSTLKVMPSPAAKAAEGEPMHLVDWLRLGDVQRALSAAAGRAY